MAALNLSFLVCSVGISVGPVVCGWGGLWKDIPGGRTRSLSLKCHLLLRLLRAVVPAESRDWVATSVSFLALLRCVRARVPPGPKAQPAGAVTLTRLSAASWGMVWCPVFSLLTRSRLGQYAGHTRDAQTLTESSCPPRGTNSSNDGHQHESPQPQSSPATLFLTSLGSSNPRGHP